MNFDPNTKAREEQEDLEEQFEDLIIAIRCLLKNGEWKAVISLIYKLYQE